MQKYLFYIICLLISLTMVCCSENDSDNSPKTTIPTKIEEDSINTKDDTNKVDTIYFQIKKIISYFLLAKQKPLIYL